MQDTVEVIISEGATTCETSDGLTYEIVCDACKGSKTENFSDWFQSCTACGGTGRQGTVTLRNAVGICRIFLPGRKHRARIINNKAVIL